MKKKLISLLTAVLLAATCFASNAYALELDDYEVSDAYKGSTYYESVTSINLTGDGRYDILAVALTQLGYHEGNKDADMHGGNTSGGKNFVEYNRLFGKLDNGEGNGTSYGYAWCASFINWCLRAADIPVNRSGAEVSCSRWVSWLTERSLYHTRQSGYEPLCGDFIFFKNAGSAYSSTHIGIVVGCENGVVYTIEGNSGDCVGYHNYSLDNTYIVGYGSPKYKTADGVDYSDFELVDVYPVVAGTYYVTARSTSVRPNASSSGGSVGKLSQYSVIQVTELKDGYGKIEFEGQTAWIQLDKIALARGLRFTVSYDAAELEPQSKKYGAELTLSDVVPVKEGYTFAGWATEPEGEAVYQPGGAYTEEANAALYAVWEQIMYTVKFVSDGNIISEKQYASGAAIDVPENPTKPSDKSYSYTFEKWDAEIAPASADAVYTAVFTQTELPGANYTIVIVITLIIVILAGLVTLYLLLKPKKGSESEAETAENK